MSSHAPVLILNLTRERVVCERGFVANRALARMRGLLGRSHLPEGEGLLLEPAYAIHTAFMRFPIDVVFLDSHMRVMKVVDSLPPWRTSGAHQAFSVLELAAGQASDRGVAAGDRLDVQAIAEPQLARALSGSLRQSAGDMAPPRILLISADRRFRSVAAALFTRRGWPVAVGGFRDDVEALVAGAEPDVALIDATHSLTSAAEIVARLERGRPGLGVVVVSDESRPALPTLPAHPKWGAFESLCLAIEQERPGKTAAPAAAGHGNGNNRDAHV
jgi:uncharacterized membrane protein (UPF0127 family)/CheY-like chemotaxis protein